MKTYIQPAVSTLNLQTLGLLATSLDPIIRDEQGGTQLSRGQQGWSASDWNEAED